MYVIIIALELGAEFVCIGNADGANIGLFSLGRSFSRYNNLLCQVHSKSRVNSHVHVSNRSLGR